MEDDLKMKLGLGLLRFARTILNVGPNVAVRSGVLDHVSSIVIILSKFPSSFSFSFHELKLNF